MYAQFSSSVQESRAEFYSSCNCNFRKSEVVLCKTSSGKTLGTHRTGAPDPRNEELRKSLMKILSDTGFPGTQNVYILASLSGTI